MLKVVTVQDNKLHYAITLVFIFLLGQFHILWVPQGCNNFYPVWLVKILSFWKT